MTFSLSRTSQFLLILALSLTVACPQSLFAQDHVVSSSELRKDLQAVSDTREKNVAQLDSFFSSEQGQKALETTHVSYDEMDKAVRSLSDDDLARLSARAQHAQNDFAAGNISTRDLLFIVVGVLVVIVIIVAVKVA